MKRNMLRRLLIVVVALVLVFAFSTTAFASGSYLTHGGTSRYSYYTDDYVSQMNDNTITCISIIDEGGYLRARPVYKVNDQGNWIAIAGGLNFALNAQFIVPDHATVRHIHLKIYNYSTSVGTPIYRWGKWKLTA